MSARNDILAGIRRALRRGPVPADVASGLVERVAAHRRNLIPARAAALDPAARVDLFVQMAEEVQTTVARVASDDAVPAEVARYLAGENLPAELVMAPDPGLDAIPWDTRPLMHIRRGRAEQSQVRPKLVQQTRRHSPHAAKFLDALQRRSRRGIIEPGRAVLGQQLIGPAAELRRAAQPHLRPAA